MHRQDHRAEAGNKEHAAWAGGKNCMGQAKGKKHIGEPPVCLCICEVSQSSGILEQERGDARASEEVHKGCLIHRTLKYL